VRKLAGFAAFAASVVTVAAPTQVDAATANPANPTNSTNVTGSANATTRIYLHGAEGTATESFYGGFDAPAEREGTYQYGPHYLQQLDAYWATTRNAAAPADLIGRARQVVRGRSGERSDGRRPGVLLLHGGYWMQGDKRAWRGVARQLNAHGYTAFSANYRLSGEARWPAQRDDALAALRYIRRNAEQFNLDPDRIIILGSSSGGHLATVLGTYGEGDDQVSGVVAISPAASPYQAYVDGRGDDVSAQRRRLRQATVQLVGCVPQTGAPVCWERLEASVAANHVTRGDARMFLAHSIGDFVPSRHSIELSERLKRAGVPVEVRILPGRAHGGDLLAEPALFERVLTWIDRAVDAEK
jgi:acetyl esterase/lipase